MKKELPGVIGTHNRQPLPTPKVLFTFLDGIDAVAEDLPWKPKHTKARDYILHVLNSHQLLLKAIKWALSDQTLTKGTREELEKAVAKAEGRS